MESVSWSVTLKITSLRRVQPIVESVGYNLLNSHNVTFWKEIQTISLVYNVFSRQTYFRTLYLSEKSNPTPILSQLYRTLENSNVQIGQITGDQQNRGSLKASHQQKSFLPSKVRVSVDLCYSFIGFRIDLKLFVVVPVLRFPRLFV